MEKDKRIRSVADDAEAFASLELGAEADWEPMAEVGKSRQKPARSGSSGTEKSSRSAKETCQTRPEKDEPAPEKAEPAEKEASPAAAEDALQEAKKEETGKDGNEQPSSGEKKSGDSAKKKKSGGLMTDLISLLLRIGWIAFIIAVFLLLICGITVNSGNRMFPAVHDRDIVLYYRLASDIKAGELVVFEGENKQLLIGRVVAKGGDTVDIDEKGLRVNGYYQQENYSHGDTVLFEGGIALPLKLKEGEYFVLCDDRAQSSDSRTFGPISSDRVRGRVMVSVRTRDF